jgi:hypothetical protein
MGASQVQPYNNSTDVQSSSPGHTKIYQHIFPGSKIANASKPNGNVSRNLVQPYNKLTDVQSSSAGHTKIYQQLLPGT